MGCPPILPFANSVFIFIIMFAIYSAYTVSDYGIAFLFTLLFSAMGHEYKTFLRATLGYLISVTAVVSVVHSTANYMYYVGRVVKLYTGVTFRITCIQMAIVDGYNTTAYKERNSIEGASIEIVLILLRKCLDFIYSFNHSTFKHRCLLRIYFRKMTYLKEIRNTYVFPLLKEIFCYEVVHGVCFK